MYKNIFSEKNIDFVLKLFNTQVTIALLVVFFLLVHYLLFVKNGGKKLPGPIGLPYLGYWPFLIKDPHKTLKKLSKIYGNCFGIYLGRNYVVVCNDYEVVKEALSKPESLGRSSQVFSLVPLGLGFASASGQEWTIQRRFSVKTMKEIGLGRPQWEELVQEEVDDIVKHIQLSQGQSLSVNEVLAGSFTNNVMTMMFGHRRPHGDPEVRRLTDNMNILMEYNPSLDLSNFLPRLNNFLLKMGLWGSQEALDRIREFSEYLKKCIARKLEDKELYEQESFVKSYHQEVEQNKKKNLNNTFTDDYLLSNTQSLVLGGSETTQNSFIWLLVSMAEHPDKQLKVHQELDAVLGKNGTIKYADRGKVPYTFATIMESMRWRTLVPISTLRMLSDDTKLQGYDIPKGTLILSNIWALHNDPKYWKNPEVFEPERFLLEDGKSVNYKPDSWIPFSFGRRNCPGEMVALTEILLYFVTLMQKFTILPPKGHTKVKLDTHLGLTYQPIGVKLRFIPRE